MAVGFNIFTNGCFIIINYNIYYTVQLLTGGQWSMVSDFLINSLLFNFGNHNRSLTKEAVFA